MKLAIAVLALVFCSAVGASAAQNHAILPEQCRADVRLWFSQTRPQNDSLSFSELEQRATEMLACFSIDTGTGETFPELKGDTDKYHLLYTAYVAVMRQRLYNYIKRHAETQQFLDEDAAGQR